MYGGNSQQISNPSVASRLIFEHLDETAIERGVSTTVIGLVAALIVLPVVLLLLSSALF